jgi:hypothetical protein
MLFKSICIETVGNGVFPLSGGDVRSIRTRMRRISFLYPVRTQSLSARHEADMLSEGGGSRINLQQSDGFLMAKTNLLIQRLISAISAHCCSV